MVVSRFPLSQAASCETMRILWRNCKNNIGPMHAHKAYYTSELCDQQISNIDSADALPDDAARTMIHEMIRLELVDDGRNCTQFWKRLKSYINGIFAGEEARKVQYNGAGWVHYEPAAAQSWQDLNDLMQSGLNYITANTNALKGPDGKNMPATFPAAFQEAWESFKTKRTEFTDAQNASVTGTADKINKINDCYTTAINMGTDGQDLFQDDEELRRLFSFEAMGAVVSPAGPASFEVFAEVDGAAKAGAEVSIEGTDKAGVTDAEGKIIFLQMQEGNITCKVVCDGYAQQLVTETITAGVRKRITVTLQPLFDGALKVGSEQPAVNSGQETVSNTQ